MYTGKRRRERFTRDLEAILEVTAKLAAPFDLMTTLGEVVAAAKEVLDADRGAVRLHDPASEVLLREVTTGNAPVRAPSGAGLVGACARDRRPVDRASGYRTRGMLTPPP
jgi:hypothetical protein